MLPYARRIRSVKVPSTFVKLPDEISADIRDDGEPPSKSSSVVSAARPLQPRTAFRKKYYPNITQKQWNDWKWQLANRITELSELSRILCLSESESAALSCEDGRLPFAVTPYYASLLDRYDEKDPLRRCVIPRAEEFHIQPCEMGDPLGEESHEAVPGLVHRYPDRVLFLVTNYCAAYCRYCTRSRVAGREESVCGGRWKAAIAYIRRHTEVRDVLISGGDPLTLSDEALEWILSEVRAIPHVEFIRIGTKTPTVLPQRITPKLAKMLKKYHPLFISVHAAHPAEFTPEAVAACGRLADAGIPLGSQTVLLKGVNDDPAVMKTLMHKLLMARVRPYYLYQCDPVRGTSHLRTSVSKGLEIISNLRGYTTGYAVPTFVIDSPGGGGKIPVSVNNICGTEGSDLLIMNFEGKIFRYPQIAEEAPVEKQSV